MMIVTGGDYTEFGLCDVFWWFVGFDFVLDTLGSKQNF